MKIKTTPVYRYNKEALDKSGMTTIINQGGSRSGKTYAICQLLVMHCLLNPGRSVDIVRDSFPALRATAYKDVLEILQECGLYSEKLHNRTNHIYAFPNGSTISFYSTSDSQKLRGRKRNIIYINEANEIDFETYMQLMLRTSFRCFLDFNPSDNQSWIYELMEDPKTILIKTTYKDNSFLPQTQIDFIENLINVDQNYYRIYALGERPIASNRVYTHFRTYREQPLRVDQTVFGLDFGFNHPTALVRIQRSGDIYYIKEEIYSSNLTTADLIERMNKIPDLKKYRIFADSARPDMIEEIKRAGYLCSASDKSVKEGINAVKACPIYVHEGSLNIMNEYNKYSWKMDGERVLDEVVKIYDDAMDAIRYGIYTARKKEVNNAFYTLD